MRHNRPLTAASFTAMLGAVLAAAAVAPVVLGGEPPAAVSRGGSMLAGGPVQNGNGFFSSFQIQNVGGNSTDVTIDYHDTSGSTVASSNGTIPAGNSNFFPIGDSGVSNGFEGSAVISADMPIAVVANITSNSDGTGTGAAYPLFMPKTFGTNGIGLKNRQSGFFIQNVDSSDTTVDIFYVPQSGNGSESFRSAPIKSGQILPFTGMDLPGGNSNASYPGYPQGYAQSGVPPVIFVHNTTADDQTVSRSYDTFPGGSSSNNCFPGTGQSSSWSVFARSDSPINGEILQYDASGNLLNELPMNVDAHAQFSGSATVSPHATCVAAVVTSPLQGTSYENYSGFNQGTGRAEEFESAAPILTDSDLITKRGVAFGAVSTKDSAVSLHVLNMGTKNAKVKVIVRDGSGKKLQGKTLKNIPPNGVAIFDYGKKARGNDLYADLGVKGSGQVFAWLVRSQDGDHQIIPALPTQ